MKEECFSSVYLLRQIDLVLNHHLFDAIIECKHLPISLPMFISSNGMVSSRQRAFPLIVNMFHDLRSNFSCFVADCEMVKLQSLSDGPKLSSVLQISFIERVLGISGAQLSYEWKSSNNYYIKWRNWMNMSIDCDCRFQVWSRPLGCMKKIYDYIFMHN